MRTKKVTWENVPTPDGVIGIANYGPTAALFTLSRNHFVQQYDIAPNNVPLQVASAQHVPANTPPTPPTTLEEAQNPYDAGISRGNTPATGVTDDTSSADEAGMSPLQKIAREMDSLDAIQSELRDKVMPLSPDSSRASSQTSRSSGGRRRVRRYLYDRPSDGGPSRASSTTGMEGTEFSIGEPSTKHGHESISIRSTSSFQTNQGYRTSQLRRQIMRSPEKAQQPFLLDRLPHTRARLRDVPFRTPHYGNVARTAELLQREMLSVVFGWNDTARALVRDELSRHRAGSASAVLLSKWLGDMGADSMASMIGSESMTSSDWMLLALSSIGSDSQRKVGEAFVQRLLEKGDVHPAVAILLGLGENNDAIEVYVSQGYWLEAILVTCLTSPADWGRICFLLRKWGEAAVRHGEAELAVRCFSCTSIETTEPWTSPRAQDAVQFAHQERGTQPNSAGPLTSPPLSPPSRSGSGRLTAKNASLKLITTFGDKGMPLNQPAEPQTAGMGVTPIAQSALPQSALSPGPSDHWQTRSRGPRDPSSARTATPGGFGRRKRLPSRNDIERAKQEAANLTTPITASRDFAPPISDPIRNRRASSLGASGGTPEPTTALKAATYDPNRLTPFENRNDAQQLPSPQAGVFSRLRDQHHRRGASRDRKPDGLEVHIMETQYTDDPSPAPTQSTHSTRSLGASASRTTQSSTDGSTKSGKGRAIDHHISSVEEAREMVREANREKRARSKRREQSRQRSDRSRGASRAREPSETRSRKGVHYIKPAKHSPSSPIPMSPEEIAAATQANKAEPATTDDESFYKVASPMSPVDSHKNLPKSRSEQRGENPPQSPEERPARSRGASRQRSPDRLQLTTHSSRGRSNSRKEGGTDRSPSAPLPIPNLPEVTSEKDDTNSDGNRIRLRAGSRHEQDVHSPGAESKHRRERSTSRHPVFDESALGITRSNLSLPKDSSLDEHASESSVSAASEGVVGKPRGMSKKELAAKELEERRLSLARRPSAPAIPMPGEFHSNQRPGMGMRSYTELGYSPTYYSTPHARAHTVDADNMSRYGKITGTSTPLAPIGLPATPRAMRHPKYMGSDTSDREQAPPVPDLPGNMSELSSLGTASNLSGMSNSALTSNPSQLSGSHLSGSQLSGTQLTSALSTEPSGKPTETDDVGPLLPSTTFSQTKEGRSNSAPPEQGTGIHPAYKSSLPHSSRRRSLLHGHVRKISPPDASQVSSVSSNHASIDETLSAGPKDEQVFIVPESKSEKPEPPMLPELQHLAGPPPPPPPPPLKTQGLAGTGSGVINIAIDENAPSSAVDRPSNMPSNTYPQPMERASTTSPTSHRRGRGSVSESFGSRFRGFGDRMRSNSRNRGKSPQDAKPSPYETVLPPLPTVSHHQRRESQSRAKSPYEQAMAMQQAAAGASHDQVPPPPPPPPPGPSDEGDPKLQETTIPPSSLPPSRTQSATSGYRNPKEIRANMTPGSLLQGVQGGFL